MSTTPATPKAPSAQHTDRVNTEVLFRRFANAHFASSSDEFREGASDAAVARRYDASRKAEDALVSRIQETEKECAELFSERDRLRDALEIYAKPENWDDEITATEGGDEECKVYTPEKTMFHGDPESRGGWEIAASALTGTTPSESARLRECNAELSGALDSLKSACVNVLIPAINEAQNSGFSMKTWASDAFKFAAAVQLTDAALIRAGKTSP